MKVCVECHELKEFHDFHINKTARTGYDMRCKTCRGMRMAIQRNIKKGDPVWVANERARNRLKRSRFPPGKRGEIPLSDRSEEWIIDEKFKSWSRRVARYAEDKGVIKNPGACEDCSVTDVQLFKYHLDFMVPLNLKWLCRTCLGVASRKKKETIGEQNTENKKGAGGTTFEDGGTGEEESWHPIG